MMLLVGHRKDSLPRLVPAGQPAGSPADETAAASTCFAQRPKMERFNLSAAGGVVHAASRQRPLPGFTSRSHLPMHETWLKPNRRALWLACVPPAVLGAIGLWMVTAGREADRYVWRGIGIALVALATILIGMLVRQLCRPRIAYRDGQVLFYLRSGPPFAVPAQFVEAFFLGQGPARLPGSVGNRTETVNLVARLSQRETEWAHQAVKPALGQWCDGYVTIRGTWCEPLRSEVIRRLNRRLKEVKTASDGMTHS
jgi:hypothetical protein